jgi:hypothetical protein
MTLIRSLNKTNMDEREGGPHVVLSGDNPANGFIIWGPFPTRREAMDWLDRACDGNGWAQPLEKPE